MDYRGVFDNSIVETFTAARRFATEPSLALFAVRTMRRQKEAADRRKRVEAEGVNIPL